MSPPLEKPPTSHKRSGDMEASRPAAKRRLLYDSDDERCAAMTKRMRRKQQRPAHLASWNRCGSDFKLGELLPQESHDDNPLHSDDEKDVQEATARVKRENANIKQTKNEQLIAAGLEGFEGKGKELEQFNENTWADMCKFLKIDLEPTRQHDYSFQMPGMLRPVLAHQLYAAFWILWHEQHRMKIEGQDVEACGFNYLADIMGLGKSTEAATLVVMGKWLDKAWTDVRASRKRGDGAHLRKGVQTGRGGCPSAAKYGICCPCVAGSVSSKLQPTRGTIILMAPAGLLGHLVKEMHLAIDMKNSDLDFTLHYQATEPPRKKSNMTNLSFRSSSGGVEEIPTDLATLTSHTGDPRIKQLQERVQAGSLDGLSSHIIFASVSCWDKQMGNTGLDGLPCGRLIRDEAHLEHDIKIRVIYQILRLALRRMLEPEEKSLGLMVTFLSGTAINLGLQDWVGVVAVMCLCSRQIQFTDLTLGNMNNTASDLQGVAKWKAVYGRLIEGFYADFTPDKIKAIPLNRQGRMFARLLMRCMIRRTGRSRSIDGRHDLLPLPRTRVREVRVCMSTELMAATHANLTKSMKQNYGHVAGKALHVLGAKAGTFPHLARMCANGDIKCTKADMDKEKVWEKSDNPFAQQLSDLVKSSPKIPPLKTILDEMYSYRHVDHRGARSVGLIFVEFNESALIVSDFLSGRYRIKNGTKDGESLRVGLMYGGMELGAKQKLVDQFQLGKLDVLVGTIQSMGTGLTLTRATWMVFLEQPTMPGEFAQAIARMMRKGNLNWRGLLVFVVFVTNWEYETARRDLRYRRVDRANNTFKELEKKCQESLTDLDGPAAVSEESNSMTVDLTLMASD